MRVILLLIVYCTLVDGQCKFHDNDKQDSALQTKIKSWQIFSKTPTLTVQKNSSNYTVGFCKEVGQNSSAIIQKENNEVRVIGRLNSVNLVGGDNWALLTYEGGDVYNDTCENRSRSASIMFVCGSNMTNITVLQHHTSTDPHCNYIFQLEVPELCPKQAAVSKKLSGGAIFLIVVLSLVSAYLVGGFLFLRFQRGARGIDQIPQLEMWRKLGHLAADGCDFCCRCNAASPRAGYFLDESGPDMRGDDDILAP